MKTYAQMKTFLVALFIFSIFAHHTHAKDMKVVVIPLLENSSEPIKNVVTVAKANGNFNSVISAMGSIKDATATNPYLIVIAPGEYQLQSTLLQKKHVHITGSGQGATILSGKPFSGSLTSNAVVKGTPDSSLRNLSIVGKGLSNSFHSGVLNDSQSGNPGRPFEISDVDINLNSGRSATGINLFNSDAIIRNVTIEITSVNEARGISYNSSIPTIDNAIITLAGQLENIGLLDSMISDATVSNTKISLSNSLAQNIGISSFETFSTYRGIDIIVNKNGNAANNTVGVSHGASSNAFGQILLFQGLIIRGAATAVNVSDSSSINPIIINGLFTDGVVTGNGIKKCIASTNDQGVALSSNCLIPQ